MAAFYNTATLSYRDTSTNSNTVEGQLVQVLAAEKTAVLPTYGSSNTVTYIVSIRNSGAAAYTGLTVTDDLGGYAFAGETRVPLTYVEGSLKYYSNGTLQPAPAVTAGAPLVIGGITVPAGGNALLIYEAEPNGYAPPAAGGTITNTASITGNGLTTPLTAQATVAAGETLIESEKLDRDGRAVPGEAAGSAIALVQKQYRCAQSLTVAAEFPTGRLGRSEAVEGLGRRLDLPWLTKPEPDGLWQEKITREPLLLFGFALPAVAVRTLWVEYARQEIRLTQEQAVDLAAWACRRQLWQEHPDAELRTEEKEQRLDGDVLHYAWTVQFEADIARPEA